VAHCGTQYQPQVLARYGGERVPPAAPVRIGDVPRQDLGDCTGRADDRHEGAASIFRASLLVKQVSETLVGGRPVRLGAHRALAVPPPQPLGSHHRVDLLFRRLAGKPVLQLLERRYGMHLGSSGHFFWTASACGLRTAVLRSAPQRSNRKLAAFPVGQLSALPSGYLS
jgi:hypothetical protein